MFVPRNAMLTHAEKRVKITPSSAYTEFAFPIDTEVGQKSTQKIIYRVNIPNCTEKSLNLDIIRQPGLRHFSVQ